jgi:hypothetical protein
MGKFISGLPAQNNLDRWGRYAKQNSYGDNKRQCRDQFAPVGRGERQNDWTMTSGMSLKRRVREEAGPTLRQ